MRIQIWIVGFKAGTSRYASIPSWLQMTSNDLRINLCAFLPSLLTNTINWSGTNHFESEDDYRTGCRNVSHCQQQQSYSGLCSLRRSCSTYSWNDSWVQSCHKKIRAKPTMNLTFQLLFSRVVWLEYDSECQVPLNLRSNRFQSSYGAKVRAAAKKKQGRSGRGRGEEEVFQNRGVCGQAFPAFPSLSPVIPFFLCCRPNFSRRTRAETLATQAKFLCKYPG